MNYPNFPGGPSMDFGMGGAPNMKGTWISKTTGETVVVRDNVITESGMTIMLSDGRMIDMQEFSAEYYQMSDDVYDMNGNKTGTNPVPDYRPTPSPAPRPEDLFPPKPMPKPEPCPIPPTPPTPCPAPDPDHWKPVHPASEEAHRMKIVEDTFANSTPTPNITVEATIGGENFPKDNLQTIISVLGVKIDDIVLYLYKNYFTADKIMEAIKTYLTETVGLVEPNTETDDDKDDTDDTGTSTGTPSTQSTSGGQPIGSF